MNNSQKKILFPLLALCCFFLAFFIFKEIVKSPVTHEKLTKSYAVMGPGIILNLTFYGNRNNIEKADKEIYQVMRDITNSCNIYNPKSELSKLNRTAHLKPVKCSDILWGLFLYAQEAYTVSDGAFDVTAGPLMKMWGFYRKRKELPNPDEIKKVVKTIGFHNLVLNKKEHTVFFKKKGILIDMGGIAKGYAVDLAKQKAIACGLSSGIINLAGNMYCFPNPPPNRKSFVIGVRDPFNKIEQCGIVKGVDMALSTSGNYERYVTIKGLHYTHIMNPKTGRPVKNMLSVTVVTPLATRSDYLSTSIFIKGEAFAKKICKIYPNTYVLIIRYKSDKEQTVEVKKIGEIWNDIDIKKLSLAQ
jgi:thiamine biosynthesis lipoprotein